MIVFSSFNDVELFHSMFVDCCMLKSREWSPIAAIGRRRPPSSIDIDRACCRNRLLPLFFLLFRRGMLPYVFLRRTQLTTTPQRPSTRRELIGRQRPPWCPTPDADAHNGRSGCWLFVVCGGAGRGAPWRPWDDGNIQGWWDTV
jgi:hypothetical protein